MRIIARILLLAGLLGASWGVAGATGPAQAHCEYATESGCSNSCIELAEAYEIVTGRPAPWYCTMGGTSWDG